MDSGTSGGSMQSGSSGEDDQNDTSFSPAPLSIPRLNHHHQAAAAAYTHHLHQPAIFTPQHLQYPPLTNSSRSDDHMNLYPHLSSNNSFLETLPQSDLDRVWSMGLNAHPQSQQQQQMFYSAAATSTSLVAAGASSSAMNNNPNAQTTTQDPQLKPAGKLAPTTQPGKENGFSSGRVVKKRSRASRKTPTTVLTTDTTNFRAMVQEFTGIPTPPFGPSALFPAKKFDLFGTNNGQLDPSLGSLLYSLNKSNNPNTNPFAPPLSHINTTSTNQNPYQQQQQSQQMMMLPSSSNFQNQNPNQAFHSSVLRPSSYPSKYSNAGGNEVDHHQLAGFSKGGENDNFSGTG